MKCRLCDFDIPNGKLKCPACNAINIGTKGITPAKDFDDGAYSLDEVPDEECVRLDVKYLNRIFGGPILNPKKVEEGEPEVNGPGLVRDSVILIGGQPGAGKSTLMLQLCDILLDIKKEGDILYIAAEEKGSQIKPRAIRLGMKHIKRVKVLPAIGGNVDIGMSIMMRKPILTIIDSVTGLAGDDQRAAVEISHRCKEYSDKLNMPIILTAHLTKGEEIAGLNTLQHAVDTVLYFRPDDDNPDVRVLEVNPKNRFGRAYIESYFLMGEKGLEPLPPGVEPADLEDEGEE